MVYKILGLFVDLLTADDKYYILNRRKLWQSFQMELSQKRKVFFQCFFSFLKFRFNFEYFEKKDDPHSFCIFKLTDSEKRG